MDCGSKGCRFNSFFLPVRLSDYLSKIIDFLGSKLIKLFTYAAKCARSLFFKLFTPLNAPVEYVLNFTTRFDRALSFYIRVCSYFKKFTYNCAESFIFKTRFISNYYVLNDLLWQEGLLFDFLQKKSLDNWIKKFVIYSANLFSERLVFDRVVRFYLDLIIWPMHKLFTFEFNNVANMLFITVFLFFLFFFIFLFFYVFLLMF